LSKHAPKHVTTIRTHRFDCKVSRKIFLDANVVRVDSWPDLTEDMLKNVAAGIDVAFLREIATQAVIALENQQVERYKLIARRLRKALNMQGASQETAIRAMEVFRNG